MYGLNVFIKYFKYKSQISYKNEYMCTLYNTVFQSCGIAIDLLKLRYYNCRTWKNQSTKVDGMPGVGIDHIATGEKTKFIRWKAHDDWVQQVYMSFLTLYTSNTR